MATVCLIDGSSYLFRAYYAIQPLTNSKGFPTHVVMGFTNMLLKVLGDLKPDYVAVVWDTPKKSFRAEKYDGYKANRDECPEDLSKQIPYVHKVVGALGFHQTSLEGFEADDLIATWATRVGDKNDVVIVSADKDLTQLVNDRVVMWDTMRDRKFTPKEVKEKFGVPPEQMRDFLSLTGDTSDSIPGVKGIGPKTALTLLEEYGSVKKIYESLNSMKPSRTKELLEKGKENAVLSYDLVGLECDVKLPETLDDLKKQPSNEEALRTVLQELELKNLLTRLESKGFVNGNTSSPKNIPGSGVSGTQQTSLGGNFGGSSGARKSGRGDKPQHNVRTLKTQDELDLWARDQPSNDRLSAALCVNTTQKLLGFALYGLSGHACYVPMSAHSEKTVESFLSTLFGTKKCQLTGYDVKALLKIFHKRDESPKLSGDTMVAAYLVDSSSKNRLDALIHNYLDLRITDLEELGKGGVEALLPDVAASLFGERAHLSLELEKKLDEKISSMNLGKLYHDMELPLVAVLAEMERTGILIDQGFLKKLSMSLEKEAKELEDKIYHLAGTPFTIQSPKQLSEILFGKLGLPPQRKTKTGLSTDVDVLETLSKLHPMPALILEFREIMKLKSTYVDALLELSDSEGRVHTSFNQAVAVTGRLSSSDPNLQNIPIRTERGRQIRQAFRAREGMDLVIADYSQIELRLMAHYSEDPRMLEAFQKGEDIHAKTAAEVFGVKLEKVSKEQRRIAKAINFGLIYGQTAYGLSQALGIEPGEAKSYIEGYFKTYAKVKTCMESLISVAREKGYAETLFGRRRQLPDLLSRNRMNVQFAERNAINTPLQGSAADIIKKAMVELHAELARKHPDAFLLLQVHDELIVESPQSESKAVASLMKQIMEKTFTIKVPLEVSVDIGAHWGIKE